MTDNELMLERVKQHLEGRKNVFVLTISEDDEDLVEVRGFFDKDPREEGKNLLDGPESYLMGLALCSSIARSINALNAGDSGHPDDEVGYPDRGTIN